MKTIVNYIVCTAVIMLAVVLCVSAVPVLMVGGIALFVGMYCSGRIWPRYWQTYWVSNRKILRHFDCD